jgi:hypothetical protein
MRRDKVLRFVTIAFAIGAFLGLIFGLAFGGDDGTAGPTVLKDNSADVSNTPAADPETDSTDREPMTADRAEAIGANELGQVLTIVYYDIGFEENDTTRAPDGLRQDLALLQDQGFFPVTVKDLVSGNIDIPAGKSPVVITFDESSPGQYRILDDGSLDADCAVGILQKAAESKDWAARASFFCLLDVSPKDNELFGQPERQQEKLRNLVDWGYEVGSNTVSRLDLSTASSTDATKELAQSKATLEDLIGGTYSVTSLAVPLGKFPESEAILAGGQYEQTSYAYTAVVGLDKDPAPPAASPFSKLFNPLRIPRIQGTAEAIQAAIDALKAHPELRYISDGDPTTVSAPTELASELGEPKDQDELGRPLIRY